MSLPCSQPGGRTQLFQPDQHLLPPAKHVRRLLVQTLRNGKSPKRVFWNPAKTHHFPTFSTFSTRWVYLAASQAAERNFFNLISTSCRQPSTFEGYLYKPSETGKVPNGSSETLLKPTIFRLFPLFKPDEPTLQPARRQNTTFSTWSTAAERNFFNLINTSCRQPSTFEGYTYKPSETEKVPNGSSETLLKPFSTWSTPLAASSMEGGYAKRIFWTLLKPTIFTTFCTLPPAKHVPSCLRNLSALTRSPLRLPGSADFRADAHRRLRRISRPSISSRCGLESFWTGTCFRNIFLMFFERKSWNRNFVGNRRLF